MKKDLRATKLRCRPNQDNIYARAKIVWSSLRPQTYSQLDLSSLECSPPAAKRVQTYRNASNQ
eukprot:548682-Lingulodinium_polyedra.AAC.1